MPIRGFIFDLDGVITDTAEFHYLSWQRLADEEGLPFTRQDNEALRGVSRRESLNRLLKGKAVDEATAQDYMERKNRYYHEYLQRMTPNNLLPGAETFLKDARAADIKLGIGSASKNARDALEKLEIEPYFDAVGDGYSVVNTKPAPDLFLWTAGRLDVPPYEAVVFEDAEAGIDAALAGAFWTVGVGTSTVQRAHIAVPGLSAIRVSDVLNKISQLQGHTNPAR